MKVMQEGGDFYLKFDLTLAPGPSLSNWSRTKLQLMKSQLHYSRVHGKIHLVAQFTNGVLEHFQNAT